MKRDARLRGLSSDHHRALVIARTLSEIGNPSAWSSEDAAALGRSFDSELEPHFRVEDDVLLPALRRAGSLALVERTEADHAFLRATIAAARLGDLEATRAFAERLRDHVRFEEQELFPACEAKVPQEVLDEVARRAPKSASTPR